MQPPKLREVSLKGIGRIYIREGTSDEAVLQQIFQARLLDVMASKQFQWIKSRYDRTVGSSETPLIIDCGANIGLSCLFFAHHLPKARIVGIEPAADNAAVAKRNIAGRPLLSILEAAVHDSSAPLSVADASAEKWAYRFVENAVRGAAVPTVTINDIMRSNGAKRNLIVKVDIEGGEKELFRSNIEWLDRTDLLIVETHDWMLPGQATSSTLFAALAGRRFEFLQSSENLFFFFT